MLRDDKLADLKRMYQLFQRVPPTLDGLRAAMAEFVRAAGRELVADQEQQKVGGCVCVFVCVWCEDGCVGVSVCFETYR